VGSAPADRGPGATAHRRLGHWMGRAVKWRRGPTFSPAWAARRARVRPPWIALARRWWRDRHGPSWDPASLVLDRSRPDVEGLGRRGRRVAAPLPRTKGITRSSRAGVLASTVRARPVAPSGRSQATDRVGAGSRPGTPLGGAQAGGPGTPPGGGPYTGSGTGPGAGAGVAPWRTARRDPRVPRLGPLVAPGVTPGGTSAHSQPARGDRHRRPGRPWAQPASGRGESPRRSAGLARLTGGLLSRGRGASEPGAIRGGSTDVVRPRRAHSRSAAVPAEAARAADGASASAAVASEPARTPHERWRAAVRAEPLERARPLPQRLMPLARAIGLRRTPRYTTGPRTRRALASAGAAGATTGDVVHVASLPIGSGVSRSDPRAVVLRHELSHASRPRPRPRFLVPGATAHDADERAARLTDRVLPASGALSTQVAARVRRPQPPGPVISPGIVASAPVQGMAAPVGRAPSTTFTPPAPSAPVARSHRLATAAAVSPSAPPTVHRPTASIGFVARQPDDRPPAPEERGETPEHSGEPPPHPAQSHPQPPDLDAIMDGIGDRLLREIERRGGRWAETF